MEPSKPSFLLPLAYHPHLQDAHNRDQTVEKTFHSSCPAVLLLRTDEAENIAGSSTNRATPHCLSEVLSPLSHHGTALLVITQFCACHRSYPSCSGVTHWPTNKYPDCNTLAVTSYQNNQELSCKLKENDIYKHFTKIRTVGNGLVG